MAPGSHTRSNKYTKIVFGLPIFVGQPTPVALKERLESNSSKQKSGTRVQFIKTKIWDKSRIHQNKIWDKSRIHQNKIWDQDYACEISWRELYPSHNSRKTCSADRIGAIAVAPSGPAYTALHRQCQQQLRWSATARAECDQMWAAANDGGDTLQRGTGNVAADLMARSLSFSSNHTSVSSSCAPGQVLARLSRLATLPTLTTS